MKYEEHTVNKRCQERICTVHAVHGFIVHIWFSVHRASMTKEDCEFAIANALKRFQLRLVENGRSLRSKYQ